MHHYLSQSARKLTTFVLACSMLGAYASFGLITPVQAANDPIYNLSDQLQRLNETTAASHTIYFVSTTTIVAGESFTINFPSGAFAFGGSYDFSDMTLAEGNSANCDTATYTPKTIAGSPSGTTWGATYAADVVTFTSGTDTIAADDCAQVVLSSNGGAHALVNPTVSANTSYVIRIAESTGASGNLAVVILDDAGTPDSDQVEIDADIGATLNFDIDVTNTDCNNNTETTFPNNIVALSTLVPTLVEHSDTTINFVCLDVGTSSPNGIDVFIQSARAASAGGLLQSAGGTIASATADLNSGLVAEGYGVRVSSIGTPVTGTFTIASPFDSATIGSVGLVPGTSASPALLVGSSAPAQTDISSRIAVEVSAKSSVGTPAGLYTDTLTFTATPKY